LKVGWAGYAEREIVITDTVGFIRDLPEDLFAAFRATFEEAADADLILHVVDAADRAKVDHIATTEAVLEELELSKIPRVIVFNKIELLTKIDAKILAKKYPESVQVSAMQRESMRPLIKRVSVELAERWDRSANYPEPLPTEPLLPEEPEEEEVHATTLEELLAVGRRRR
jgi:GTP-binding protein HflX